MGEMEKRVGAKRIKIPKRYLTDHVRITAEASTKKAAQALELRKAGASYPEIARVVGYHDASGARKAVRRAQSTVEVDGAMETILLDLERLNEYQVRCTDAMRKGDLTQVDRLMRIMQQRWAIMGVTAETIAEWMQARLGGNQPNQQVTNNNTLIIQGTETDYVRKMMEAVGTDPNSIEGRRTLEQLGELTAGKSELQEHHRTGRKDLPILDAEVVNDEQEGSQEAPEGSRRNSKKREKAGPVQSTGSKESKESGDLEGAGENPYGQNGPWADREPLIINDEPIGDEEYDPDLIDLGENET